MCVRHKGGVALAGDGQVTLGSTVMKHTAKKVRKLYQNRCLAGFAGATADAFTLLERFEKKLEQYNGNITRASVELAKDWRTDRLLRQAGSAPARCRRGAYLHPVRYRGRDRAGRRDRCDRFRWTLCPGRREGTGQAFGPLGTGDCQGVHGDCRADLHLHE